MKNESIIRRSKLVGILGVVGSGKDYNGDILKSLGYKKLSFANPLVTIMVSIFGDIVLRDYEKFKNTRIVFGFFKKVFRGRHVMQAVGSTLRRVFGEDIFIRALERQKNILSVEHDKFYISDVRHLNESHWVLANQGILLFCNFKSQKYSANINHESEFLAQALIELGLEDGDIVTSQNLHDAFQLIYDRELGGL